MKRMLFITAGCLLTSIGTLLLQHSGVLTGGTAGISLLLSYASGLPFGLVFFMVNIPFYVLSVLYMGWSFTLSTGFSVTVLCLMTGADRWLPPFTVPTFIGASAGGAIIGLGLSLLFTQRTSLGGSNILALILQKTKGWNPGTLNFVFDFAVVAYGFYSVGFIKGSLSVLSIWITSGIISYFKTTIAASNRTDSRQPTSRRTPSAAPLTHA